MEANEHHRRQCRGTENDAQLRRMTPQEPTGGHAEQSGASQCPNGNRRQVWMCVEVGALPCHGRLECRTMYAAREASQCRLDAEADAISKEGLIVPGALDGEKPSRNVDPG